MTPFLSQTLIGGAVNAVFEAPDVITGCQGYYEGLPCVASGTASTDVVSGAARYTNDGRLRIVDATSALPSGASVVDGFAFDNTGRLCVTYTAPSTTYYIGGTPVRSDGAVYMAPGFVFDFIQSANPLFPTGLTTTTTIDADGTYVNSSGLITQKTANVWPLDYLPSPLSALGRPVWEARTNLLLRSAEFDNASWTPSNATIGANAVTSPDGTVNADKIQEDTSTAIHSVLQVVTVVTATVYTMSVYAKAAERSWLSLTESLGVTATAYFNLSAGTVGTVSGTGSPSATIANAGNGWWRCTLTFTSSGTSARVRPGLATGNGVNSYTGTAGSGVFIWGAQLEAGSFPTPYIPTTTASVARAADACSIALAGLPFNASQGTLVVEWIKSTLVGNTSVAEIHNGTANDRFAVLQSGTSGDFRYVTGGVATSPGLVAGAALVNSVNRSAVAYAVGASQAIGAVNGTLGAAASPAAGLVNVTTINLGSAFNGTAQLNGWLRKLYYYPVRMSNATLQSLST